MMMALVCSKLSTILLHRPEWLWGSFRAAGQPQPWQAQNPRPNSAPVSPTLDLLEACFPGTTFTLEKTLRSEAMELYNNNNMRSAFLDYRNTCYSCESHVVKWTGGFYHSSCKGGKFGLAYSSRTAARDSKRQTPT